ncbi:MAG: enoyl-CoA hydratase/isomerase family protein, partial [Mycobacterium sp.]
VLNTLDYANAAEEQSFQTEDFRQIVARLNAPK